MLKTLGMTMLVLGVFFAVVGCDSKKPPASTRPAPEFRTLTLDLGDGVTMKLVRIPAGKFVMGSPQRQPDPADNLTQHEVTISKPFYMGVCEVTQAQWQAVMGTNPSYFKGDNRPVEGVYWDDCQAFCKKLSEKTGRKVRLPTEAEWEYACRAGTKTRYYFGDDVSQLARHAWYRDSSLQHDWVSGTDRRGTRDVGGRIPNAWGLYDMHGNALEWCQDWYGAYSANSQTDPTGPSNGRYRVLRGGGWRSLANYCRVAYRYIYYPDNRYNGVGFRLALDSE